MPLTGSISASNVYGFAPVETNVVQTGSDPLKMGVLEESVVTIRTDSLWFRPAELNIIQTGSDPLKLGVLEIGNSPSASVDTLLWFKPAEGNVIQTGSDPLKMEVFETNVVKTVYGVFPKFGVGSAYVISKYHLGDSDKMISCATQSSTEGTPAPPSLQLVGKQAYSFLWKMEPATHSIQVKVKQARNVNASTRPSVYIPQNQDMGITGSLEVFAASGSQDWVTIGPIELVVSNAGAIYVELRANATEYQNNPCYWDNIVLS